MKTALFSSLLTLVLVVSCSDPNAGKAKALEAEIDQLQKSISEAQGTVRRLETQAKAAKDERKRLEEDKTKAAEQKSKAEQDLEALKKEFDAYKARYKLSMRSKVPGLELPSLLARGQTFQQVRLLELTDTHTKFAHANGMATVSLAELAEAAQDMLGLGPTHDALPQEEGGAGPLSKTEVKQQYELSKNRRTLETEALQQELSKARGVLDEAQALEFNYKMTKKAIPANVAEHTAAAKLRVDQIAAQLALRDAQRAGSETEYQIHLRQAPKSTVSR